MWRIQVLPIRAQSFTSLIADFISFKKFIYFREGEEWILYTGNCHDKNDAGNVTDCKPTQEGEDGAACMAGIISKYCIVFILYSLYIWYNFVLIYSFFNFIAAKNGTLIYIKNCMPLLYHSRGCLQVDEEDVMI